MACFWVEEKRMNVPKKHFTLEFKNCPTLTLTFLVPILYILCNWFFFQFCYEPSGIVRALILYKC